MMLTVITICVATAVYAASSRTLPGRMFTTQADQKRMSFVRKKTLTLSEAALCLELMSALMGSGASLGQAMQVLGRQQPQLEPLIHVARGLEHGLSWNEAWEPHAVGIGWATLARELRFVHVSAAPTAAMLIAAAAQLRNHESFQIRERSQQLSTKLVLPTGLLSLPAFICWGILPAVIALVGEIQLM